MVDAGNQSVRSRFDAGIRFLPPLTRCITILRPRVASALCSSGNVREIVPAETTSHHAACYREERVQEFNTRQVTPNDLSQTTSATKVAVKKKRLQGATPYGPGPTGTPYPGHTEHVLTNRYHRTSAAYAGGTDGHYYELRRLRAASLRN